ncbi:TauD/TfdA family dioxygenase [Cognatishimia sp. F0-27]|uniref:TauD/TfdA dioxygenase family protein n=1 Tax=Cognatishimia sp. F0-27 TaxID=2816855 RepID=UPI001D0C381A|nr:TauD/TfdA family dioxygenase [Cognatishimia sp. F0-27]MCC1495050.1 TauD/TfdA family dioxygenase [Cognatishimia sp. F0-27]
MNVQHAFGQIISAPMDTEAVRKAAAEYGVVKVDAESATVAEFAAFMETLGPPMFTTGETPAPDFPMLNVVSNVGRKTKPKSVFHSDTTYVARPPSFSGLYAVDVPEAGGATLFVDQSKAYDRLPATLKELLIGATVHHRVTGVDLPEGEEAEARHPVVRRHPDTKRMALYLTTPARLSDLRLRDGTDRSDLIEFLYDHSIRGAPTHRHHWSKGDILVWDNRCTLHAADHSAVLGDRVLYRALVRGEAPA